MFLFCMSKSFSFFFMPLSFSGSASRTKLPVECQMPCLRAALFFISFACLVCVREYNASIWFVFISVLHMLRSIEVCKWSKPIL